MLHIRQKITKITLIALIAVGILAIPSISLVKSDSNQPPYRNSISLKLQTAKAVSPQYEITQVLAGKQTKVQWVKSLYEISRGFLNVLLFLILVYIAFMNILNREMNNYAIKAILPKIIIVAVVANLALPIFTLLSGVVDNIQTNVGLFKPQGIDWDYIVYAGGNIWQSMGFWAIFGIIGLMITGGITGFGCIIAGILILGAIIIIILLNLILAFRPYVVLLSAAVAPIAIGCYILPQTKSLFDRWIKIALPWLFLPLPVFFLINLGWRIPLNFSIAGDGAVSSIIGVFLPAAFRAGLLILAIRFPFTIEKDVTAGIKKLGELTAMGAKAGIKGMGAWEKQNGWPEKWKNTKGNAPGDRFRKWVGTNAQKTGAFVNRPGEAIWKGKKINIPIFGEIKLANTVPSLKHIAFLPELIKQKKERNESLANDALIENSSQSPYFQDLVVRRKLLKESLKEKHADRTPEELSADLRDFGEEQVYDETTNTDVERKEFVARRLNNVNPKLMKKMYKRALQNQLFLDECAAQRANMAANPPQNAPAGWVPDERDVGAAARASLEAAVPALGGRSRKQALNDDIEALEQAGGDYAGDIQTRSTLRGNRDLITRMFGVVMDESASNKSNKAIEDLSASIEYGGAARGELATMEKFEDNVAKGAILKTSTSRQREPVGLDEVIGESRGAVRAAQRRKSFAGGSDDEEEETSADSSTSKSSGSSSTQKTIIQESQKQNDMRILNANQDVSQVLERLPSTTSLSVESIRKMAKAMKLEGAFSSDHSDSAASAAIIASRLEKVMSPDRFASFSGAMARGDDVTVNNVLQGAKGQERDLLHASIASNEIAKAHALESGEAQNVAVYATRIAPQFASIKNNTERITQLKQSAETIMASERNAAINSSQPAGKAPLQTLTPEALEPHKKAIAQMIGISPDTVDASTAQFFLRATDALQTATSKPRTEIKGSSEPKSVSPTEQALGQLQTPPSTRTTSPGQGSIPPVTPPTDQSNKI